MTKFKVDPPKLAEAVKQLTDFHTAVRSKVSEAETVMARLAGSWDSEAADAAQEAHRRLVSGAEEMRQALAGLKGFLDNAHGAYTGAIKGNSQMWGVDQAP